MRLTIKRLLSALLIAVMTVSMIPVFAQESSDNSDYILKQGDDAYVKTYISGFGANLVSRGADLAGTSGWDFNTAGGSITSNSRPPAIIDSSTYLTTSGTRRFEDITYGDNVDFFYRFTFNKKMPGNRVRLANGDNSVLEFYFDGDTIYYIDGNGTMHVVDDMKVGVEYYVRTIFNFDTKTVKEIKLDGKVKLTNLSLTSTTEPKIDNFKFETGKEAPGTFTLSALSLTRGRIINESFSANAGGKPSDWEYDIEEMEGQNSTAGSVTAYDLGYVVLKASDKRQKISKTIDPQTGRFIYEFQLFIPEYRDGIDVSIDGANGPILTISADKKNFYYDSGDGKTAFYDYMKHCWYHFKLDVDTVNKKFNMWLNGKKKVEDGAFKNAAPITGTSCVVEGGTVDVWVDNFLLHPYEEVQGLPDYVPEPVKAKKLPEYEDIDVGMQVCPMWTEGLHFGWEYVERSKNRTPLLGYYDEPSPEGQDWSIKWMLEHGIDFIWYTFYKGGTPQTPVQDTFQTQIVSEGYFYAKYSDQLPFAIFWENAVGGAWAGETPEKQQWFLDNFAPYLIEHYFKDPRDYTINGRPVMGAYYLWNTMQNFGSGDTFKSFWNRFGDMCEERGVGRPILIQQMNTVDMNEYSGYLEDFAKMGIGGTYQYTHGETVGQDQLKSTLDKYNAVQNVKAGPMQFIPNVSDGFSDWPWGLRIGYQFEPEEYYISFKNILEGLGDWDAPLGQKMMILGTWDEYNEGHYIAPTQQYGFGKLDAIRKALCGESEHEDIEPTDAQKDRFNNLYFAGRSNIPVRERVVPHDIPEGSEVVKAWNFDDNSGFETSVNATSVVEDGVVHLTTNGGEVQLLLKDINMQVGDVTHAKIRLKSRSNDTEGLLNFQTNKVSTYDYYNGFIFELFDDGEYHDVVLPISRNFKWDGLLTNLQLRLGISNYNKIEAGDEFWIDSIELYGKPSDPEADLVTLNVDDVEKKVDYVLSNGRPLLPLRTVVNMLGGKIDWFGATSEIAVKVENNVAVISTDKGSLAVNNTPATMPAYEVRDGVTYMDLDLFAMLTDKDISWNEATKAVRISDSQTVSFVRSNEERTLIWGTDFNTDGNAEGWGGSWLYGASFNSVSDGCYNFTTTTGQPILYAPFLQGNNINLDNVKAICIGLRTGYDISIGKMYYTTMADTSWDERKATVWKATGSKDIQEVTILTDDFNKERWTGQLYRLRFDFPTGQTGQINLDYVRLYGDFETELSQKEFMARFDSMTYNDEGISWTFDINNERDGWRFNKSIADVSCVNGWLSFETLQTDAVMETAKKLDINAENINDIELRYKNMTGGTKAKVYFITKEDSVWNNEKSFDLNVSANDKLGSIYKIHVADNSLWKGNVTGLRFIPSDCAGVFEFDYIKLNNK